MTYAIRYTIKPAFSYGPHDVTKLFFGSLSKKNVPSNPRTVLFSMSDLPKTLTARKTAAPSGSWNVL